MKTGRNYRGQVSLKRALRNLIENAVIYGAWARVGLRQSDTEIRIDIRDNESGIPEEDFERVVQPFVRLETSRNQATGGIGLGMSIARSIVHNHGGDISLAKADGGGFLVTIHLPVQEPTEVGRPEVPPVPSDTPDKQEALGTWFSRKRPEVSP